MSFNQFKRWRLTKYGLQFVRVTAIKLSTENMRISNFKVDHTHTFYSITMFMTPDVI